ncbi:unnamed protein product, partial [Didymodactylos carnosus]
QQSAKKQKVYGLVKTRNGEQQKETDLNSYHTHFLMMDDGRVTTNDWKLAEENVKCRAELVFPIRTEIEQQCRNMLKIPNIERCINRVVTRISDLTRRMDCISQKQNVDIIAQIHKDLSMITDIIDTETEAKNRKIRSLHGVKRQTAVLLYRIQNLKDALTDVMQNDQDQRKEFAKNLLGTGGASDMLATLYEVLYGKEILRSDYIYHQQIRNKNKE